MAENRSTGGTGLPGLLLVAFIILKLLGKITWSWWWVLSPAWIPLGLLGLVIVVLAFIKLWMEGKRG